MYRLIAAYWFTKESRMAWVFLVLLLLCSAADVSGVVYLSYWRNDFWASIQAKEVAKFLPLILKFTVVAFVLVLAFAYGNYIQGKLALYWRTSLTKYLLERFGKLNVGDNPDQRIQEDCQKFPALTLQVFGGALSSVVRFLALASILWLLSTPISAIPGLLLWISIGYAILGSGITVLVGRKFTGLQYENQQKEANFRYGLVELRQGTDDKKHTNRYAEILDNVHKILFKQKLLSLWSSSYGQASIIFPLIILAPFYFSGVIPFGTLMQANSAMGEAGSSLSYFVDSYGSITQWSSCKQRLVSLIEKVK